ncbi:hypothetical protein HZA45_01040, partial [Candidatus Peregrinibacteria bacterium]|nr:hypothetical protein [Candidatus Peregrinibacteria bacterium]
MRSYERIFFPACLAVFAAIILFLLPARLLAPIGGDALSYNNGAISILTKHMYSQDFITPFYDREPGMSIFIAAVYTIFGIGNIAA